METHSGKIIDPANVDPCLVDVADVAYHLARIFRFTGATETSVAEHAVDCAFMAYRDGQPIDVQFACLHHDSHEYLFGDMPHDLKLLCPDFTSLEKCGQEVVLDALGVPWSDSIAEIVKMYDHWGAYIEAVNYLPSKASHWPEHYHVPDRVYLMEQLKPEDAEARFLQAHLHLWELL